jgi:hypothetical protein
LHESFLDALDSLLSFFGDITALTADEQYLALSHQSDKTANELITALNDAGLLQFSMELFATLRQAQDTMTEVRKYHSLPQQSLFAPGFLSLLAKLVSNLTYLQPKHIDAVFLSPGQQHFLGIILMNTRIDDNNPTMREWCLMIIRNMCQASEGVRECLRKLKKQDQVSQDVIQEIGLKEYEEKINKKYV